MTYMLLYNTGELKIIQYIYLYIFEIQCYKEKRLDIEKRSIQLTLKTCFLNLITAMKTKLVRCTRRIS